MSRENDRKYYAKKLLQLFKKFNNGDINPVEREFADSYDNWFDKKENLYKQNEEGIADKMLQDMHEKMFKTSKLSFFHNARFYKLAAAAIIIAFFGIYIKYSSGLKKSKTATNSATVLHDVAPGFDGAVLTLSNGKKIALDSSSQSTNVIYDGNTQIKKQNGAISYSGNGAALQYNTVSTPVGRQWKLILPDGTEARLNAVSSIRYPLTFAKNNRTVAITGEVYFKVKHNAQAPFVVKAGRQIIEDIGTEFDVNAYDNEAAVKTTLIEGSVKVSAENNGKSMLLQPGQQVILDKKENLIVKNNADTGNIIAWKNGITSFKEADIYTIMRQLSRWYNIDVRYEGNIPERRFSGEIMRNANLSDVFKILEESDIHFEIENNTVTVTQ